MSAFKSEKAGEAWLIDFLRKQGAFVQKINLFYTVGFPDLLVIWAGHVAFYELKAPGKYPTAIQWSTLRKLHAAGAHAFVVTLESRDRVLIQPADSPSSGHWILPTTPLLWMSPEAGPGRSRAGKPLPPCPP